MDQRPRARGLDDWLGELERAYSAPGVDQIGKRFASWRGSGDTAALLYLLVEEIRALRADLAAAREREHAR